MTYAEMLARIASRNGWRLLRSPTHTEAEAAEGYAAYNAVELRHEIMWARDRLDRARDRLAEARRALAAARLIAQQQHARLMLAAEIGSIRTDRITVCVCERLLPAAREPERPATPKRARRARR
jgi:hypothetical protein